MNIVKNKDIQTNKGKLNTTKTVTFDFSNFAQKSQNSYLITITENNHLTLLYARSVISTEIQKLFYIKDLKV